MNLLINRTGNTAAAPTAYSKPKIFCATALDLSSLNDNQYYEISLSFGPKVVNGQFSVLVNKYGDVFDSYGASIGISADALPIRADINIITVNGLGDSEKSMKEKMRDYMKGV